MTRAATRRWLVDRGVLFAVAVAALYLATASPYIVDGDNSEFATLGAIGGTAHPTGYPAYVLWLRAWSWLPVAPAHASALATALLAAIAAWALYGACRAWGAHPLAATLAAGLYAVGPAVLRVATAAEVFAMNQAIAALVIWLAARAGPLRGAWRVAALGLVAGLGLADQVTCVLVAPVGLLGAVRGVREATRGAAAAALGIGAVALGLTCYAYLIVAPDSLASWGHVDSAGAIVRHFLREDYGGPGSFSPTAGDRDPARNEVALAATLGRGLLWLPALLGVAWLAIASVRRARADAAEPRVAWALLAASFALAGPLVVARFDIAPTGIGLYVCRRFHVLALVPLVPAIAVGATELARRVRYRPPRGAAAACVIGGVAAAAAWSLPEVAAVHSPANEVGITNLLRSLPDRAVVIHTESELHFGIDYLQLARGERPDVTEVTWSMVGFPWYRDKLAARGLEFPKAGDGAASVRMAAAILASGRPLFIDQFESNIAQNFPTYPYGIVFRVLPAGSAPPSIEDIFAMNQRVFGDYELGYELPGLDDEFATLMHERYVRAWKAIGDGLAATGHAADAQVAYDLARQLGPQP